MSVAAVVGRQLAERQRIIFHYINGSLSSRCPGSQRTAQTLTVCARFRVSYGYFHIWISDPKFDIWISGYRLSTLILTDFGYSFTIIDVEFLFLFLLEQ